MLGRSTLLVLTLAAAAHGFSVSSRPLVPVRTPSRPERSTLSMIEPMNSGYTRGGSYGGSSAYTIDDDRRSRSPGLRNNFYDKPISDFKRPYGQRAGSSSYGTSRVGSYDDPDYGWDDPYDQDEYRDSYHRRGDRGSYNDRDRDRYGRGGRAGGRNFRDMGRRASSGMRNSERHGSRSMGMGGMRSSYGMGDNDRGGRSMGMGGMRSSYGKGDNDYNRQYGQRGGSSYDVSRGYRRGSYPDPYASTRRGMINYDFDYDYENSNGYGPSYRRSSYNNDYGNGRGSGLDLWEDDRRYGQEDYALSRRGNSNYNNNRSWMRWGGRQGSFQGRDMHSGDQRRALMKLDVVQDELDVVQEELDSVHNKLDTVLAYARASNLNYDGADRA